MAKVKIDLDSRGMKAVLTSSETTAALKDAAETIAARARAAAPVASGEYRDSITVVTGMSRGGDRAAARVTATAPHARIVEAKTGNLKRALGR